MSAASWPIGERWRVRPMLVADLTPVAAIEQQIYPFPWTRGNFADSLASGYDSWVFERGRSLVGYAIVMWLPDEVHLLNLSVAADCQGEGLGGSMLAWLMTDAARRGASSMLLEVRPSNVRAIGLYERKGFVRIGIRRKYYPSYNNTREDAIVMSRRLIGATPTEGTAGSVDG